MDGVQEMLYRYAGRASFILHEYLNLILPFYEKPNENISSENAWIMKQLPISCHLSTESALVLIGNNRLWDAETIVRSVIEGTVKFLFTCTKDRQEREKRLKEFWDDLPMINKIKRYKKAVDLLSVVSNPESDEWAFIREIVSNDYVSDEEKGLFTKNERKALEQKWSFSEMVKKLTADKEVKGLIGLAYGYSIGSHLIHQDADAINLIFDRNRRDTLRREAMELAHGAGRIRDLLAYASLRYLYTQNVFLGEAEVGMVESHLQLAEELNEFLENFIEIEKDYSY